MSRDDADLGHVYRFEGARGQVWRAKYRLPTAARSTARSDRRGRSAAGRGLGSTPSGRRRPGCGSARPGARRDAAGHGPDRRDVRRRVRRVPPLRRARPRPQAVDGGRLPLGDPAHLVPAFGSLRLEDVTADRIEAWKATLHVGNRTKIKLLTVLNGVLVRARRVLCVPLSKPDEFETRFKEIAPTGFAGQTDKRVAPPAIGDPPQLLGALETWWLLLLGLASLARYNPALWTAALDVDRSPLAVGLQRVLSGSRSRCLITSSTTARPRTAREAGDCRFRPACASGRRGTASWIPARMGHDDIDATRTASKQFEKPTHGSEREPLDNRHRP